MLYIVTGASGSGKTACISFLKDKIPNMVIHDFDEIGVPDNPDKVWRQESTEKWLQVYLKNSEAKFCICGQIVLGEILACPSIKRIGKINILLLDVSDIERIKRLRLRNTYGVSQDMLNWSSWLRMHHYDPQWHQNVIKSDCWQDLVFSEWESKDTWDELAFTSIFDTTNLPIEQVSAHILNWLKTSEPL